MTDKEKTRLRVALGIMSGSISPLEFVDDGPGVTLAAVVIGASVEEILPHIHKEKSNNHIVSYTRAVKTHAEGIVYELILRALGESE